jgi:hypothetical protein
MSNIRNLIRKMEVAKAPFEKLIILGSIQDEIDKLKKVISKKIK